MNLSTNYLGLKLRTPLVAAASPLSQNLDGVRQLEDAGASAVVLYSLFEEQFRHEPLELPQQPEPSAENFSRTQTFLPEGEKFNFSPEEYLRHIDRAKKAVKIPVIASLNASSRDSWTEYTALMQQAGADALELNIYSIPTDMNLPGQEVEQRYLDILRAVKAEVTIPVAVKVSPFFSNFAHMAKQLQTTGADGLVLFNRFYQPDIDLESLEVRPNILLSTPMAMRLPLHWMAQLHGKLHLSLAATSGIYRAADALKMLMAGADVVMLCSTLIRHGVKQTSVIEHDLAAWLEAHQYESVQQIKGSLSRKNCPDPAAFERAQYVQAISDYHAPSW